MPIELPPGERMVSGHLACAGCGAAIAMRFVLKGLGDRVVLVIPACCWTIIGGPFPYSAVRVPVLHTAFETAAVILDENALDVPSADQADLQLGRDAGPRNDDLQRLPRSQ